MATYWIFLLSLWVAIENGVHVPAGVVATAIILAMISTVVTTIQAINKEGKK